jgi:hypothetical protein
MLFSHREEDWDKKGLANELRTNVSAVENMGVRLSSLELINVDEKKFYHYKPKNEDLDQKVKLLFDVYKEKPVAVIAAIYEKPRDQLKGLADAFKLKKD